jgi:phosphatidylserine/phosphatidylglycerophosphate/cardiolipin synthase-like enzyme
MDRRSFDLNYENNILLYAPTLAAAMRERQQDYISRSRPALKQEVAAWPVSLTMARRSQCCRLFPQSRAGGRL